MESASQSNQKLRYWLANEDWYISSHTRDWLVRTPPEEAARTLAEIAESAGLERGGLLSLAQTLLAAFSISGSVTTGPASRKAGIRAAIMLGRMKDARAISPLARVYTPSHPGKYHKLIEEALTDAISHGDSQTIRSQVSIVEGLAEIIWTSVRAGRDFDNTRADLLIAAMSALVQPGAKSASGIVRMVAESRSEKPNRVRAREAARELLGQ